tara:strand:+ start:383 stop:598 length:216 start_codon:yes stop_codon:yes gene_type:complete
MGVRRRRKGQPVQIILDGRSFQELEMHARDAERQQKAQERFISKHRNSKAANRSLAETLSSAVQSMRIEDA